MRKLDEIITRIEEEELYSGLESQELLSEAPLTEREAKKLFEQVRTKREGKSKPKRHRKSKRLMILIAAAALLIGGITVGAAAIAPMLNTWKPGDGQIGLSGGFGLEGLVAEKYLQNCPVIGTESTSGGITIKVGRVFVQGNVTIAELDVITPHLGAKASEAVEWENSNDWFPLFSFEFPSAGYEDLMKKEDYFAPIVDNNSVSVFTDGKMITQTMGSSRSGFSARHTRIIWSTQIIRWGLKGFPLITLVILMVMVIGLIQKEHGQLSGR